MILYPIIAAIVIAADQFTKYLVRAGMQPGDSIPVLGDWLRFYYVRNTGTAFSMFSGNVWITIVFTSILILACIIIGAKEARGGSKTIAVLLTFICAGGLSNLFDRIALGYVTDMISCWSFAVFNVADIAVTCGCIALMIYLIATFKDEEKGDA
jgi:signal peptidase II